MARGKLRLLVVESPAKANTIKKYLGSGYNVVASYGHVRDLLAKKGSVDPEHQFRMTYASTERSKSKIAAIAKALTQADQLLLATDPDREGEAIAWHILELMKEQQLLGGVQVQRVVFHEITKTAILEAIKHPRQIAMDLVQAQLARRALDYLVGFHLSPLLWKKIHYGLSAGRVQSPALRLIVNRADEIAAFKPQEYWDISAQVAWPRLTDAAAVAYVAPAASLDAGASKLDASTVRFTAKLMQYQGHKLEQFTLNNKEQVAACCAQLQQDAAGELRVSKVTKKRRERKPAAPFTTSTLQQEASRKLHMSAKQAMSVAQKLYEAGYITYMRTDAVTLAAEAIEEIRQLIEQLYGASYVPSKPQQYRNKSKNAQEAHEAIRPTHVTQLPEQLAATLPPEQAKLYRLIWRRTMASQMLAAQYNVTTVELATTQGEHLFTAHGSVLTRPGFLALYQEGVDAQEQVPGDADGINGLDATTEATSTKSVLTSTPNGANSAKIQSTPDESTLPPLRVGDLVSLLALLPKQHFTEPPPPYTEASLVKTLEAYGIGRPSTYAMIIETLLNRKYVILNNNRQFYPTDIGRVVAGFLEKYFTTYVDYDFTAGLEDKLDQVAKGKTKYLTLLEQFWQPFKQQLELIDRTVSRQEVVVQEQLAEQCPQCGAPLQLKLGKKGRFISCSRFPACDFAKPMTEAGGVGEITHGNDGNGSEFDSDSYSDNGFNSNRATDNLSDRNTEADAADTNTANPPLDRSCPKCHGALRVIAGRFGKFIGCSNYPKCKYLEPLNPPVSSGVCCPVCQHGDLVKRRSRKGRIFYACSRYPACKYALWDQPIAECCPQCHYPILTLKHNKSGNYKACPKEGCNWSELTAKKL